jgi:CheY-like chemotaxis protein
MNIPVTLLIVEDDDDDFEFVKVALSELNLTNPILRAIDGQDALDILKGENDRDKLQGPFIILLDIYMPRLNGIEFLEIIRKDKALNEAMVFIFSSSEQYDDIRATSEKGIAGFILKSDIVGSFRESVDSLGLKWTLVS